MADNELSPAERLFRAALDVPENEREAFIRANAPGPEVAGEALSLLAEMAKAEDFLSQPAGERYVSWLEETPVRIEELEIIGVIGRGGMGIVYEARDTTLNRRVAVKVIRADRLILPEMRVRFCPRRVSREFRELPDYPQSELANIFATILNEMFSDSDIGCSRSSWDQPEN